MGMVLLRSKISSPDIMDSGLVWLPEHGPWRFVKRGRLRGNAGSLSSGHAHLSCVQFAAAHGWSQTYASIDWRVSQQQCEGSGACGLRVSFVASVIHGYVLLRTCRLAPSLTVTAEWYTWTPP